MTVHRFDYFLLPVNNGYPALRTGNWIAAGAEMMARISGESIYPDWLIPKPEHAVEPKKRTLTNLCNQGPAWLDHAHRALNEVASAGLRLVGGFVG